MMTKYELATELRALNRGSKALSICRMKKHELEAEIDRLKILKGIVLPEYAAAKPGPIGPRSIKVETTEEGISVPAAPAKRIVSAGKIKVGDRIDICMDDQLFPTMKVATSVKAPSLNALPVRSGLPAAPKRSHTCNCPACPEKVTPV